MLPLATPPHILQVMMTLRPIPPFGIKTQNKPVFNTAIWALLKQQAPCLSLEHQQAPTCLVASDIWSKHIQAVNQPRIICFNLYDMMYFSTANLESRFGYHFPSCHKSRTWLNVPDIAGFPEKMVQKPLTIAELFDLSQPKWMWIDFFKLLSWQLHEQ